MDEIDEEIVSRYHTSPAAAASEVTMRQAMRRSGYTEQEIDQTLLVGYLQQHFFRRWATIACLSWLGLWFLDVFGGLWILIAGIVGLLLVLMVLARIHAHAVAKREDWVRVKGGWVRRDKPN